MAERGRGPEAGRRLGRVLAPAAYRVRTEGAAQMPASGPLLVIANHSGFLDGPLIYCMLPRPVHFLVKRSYFRGPLGSLLRGVGQIPIEQRTGDRAALTQAQEVLNGGEVVGIFPEGTRGSGSVESAQQGAAYLAMRTGAPLLPVAVLGTRVADGGKNSWPRLRSPLEVTVGAPFRVDEGLSGPGRERLRTATARVRDQLAAHVTGAVAASELRLPGELPAATG